MGVRGRKRFRKRVSIGRAVAASAGAQAGGDDNEIQLNLSGNLAASNRLSFDGSRFRLTGTLESQGNLGVNMSGEPLTHGITLPDSSAASGQVKANAFVTYSSIRFKKDVQKLENAMDIINKLEGVSYKWKDTEKQDYGFIAEDVNSVLPEIVEWDEDHDYATSMDYMKIVSFLVEAVKFQHNQLNELTEKINNGSE